MGEERLISIAGNPALTGFQAPKILWLRDEEPENYSKVAAVLLPKDYVSLKLTGEHATDASDAAGTLLLDVGERDWSGEILGALEIPAEWMPKVYEGPENTGPLDRAVAEELGSAPRHPRRGGRRGQRRGRRRGGRRRGRPPELLVGTSGVLFAPTDGFVPDPSGRIHAFCHAVPGAYHLMGVTSPPAAPCSGGARPSAASTTLLVEAASEIEAGAEGSCSCPTSAASDPAPRPGGARRLLRAHRPGTAPRT